jgi:hypothetical protein
MLNESQIEYLASLISNRNMLIKHNDIVTGIKIAPNNKQLVIDYNEFKYNMGLKDIKFHWLLGKNSYIAGGAACAWVLSETFNTDTDLFFTNVESANALCNLIEGFNFYNILNTETTATYKYKYEDGTECLIQLIGVNDPPYEDIYYGVIGGKAFNLPFDTIKKFDFTVVQLAIDCDNIYTYSDCLYDLLTMSLNTTGITNTFNIGFRTEKYLKKGFFKLK